MDFGIKQNYSWKYFFQQLSDLATKKLINSTNEYNSFIFGSSRSASVYACYLDTILPNSSFFHYASWNESIGGICNKLELIDSLGYSIDNVIIYIDTDCTFKDNGECNVSDHYLITKVKKSEYLVKHFNCYYKNLSLDKIKILFGLKVSGNIFPNWNSDLITNDPNHYCNDPNVILDYSKIQNSSNFIHRMDSLRKIGFLYKRPINQKYYEDHISEAEIDILFHMLKIFKKHSTQYFIVISPLYDQIKLSAKDQNILLKIFKSRLFDFSGINSYTNNDYNYPDNRHFQPYISKCILDSIITAQKGDTHLSVTVKK